MFRSHATKLMLIAAAGVTAFGVATVASASTDVPPSAASATAESEGFASAEDAVAGYLEAISAGDLAGATATFSIEVYVDRFDFEGWIESTGYYQSSSGGVMPLPSGNPLNTELNVERRRANVTGQVLNQYFALLNPELDRTRGERVDDAAEFTDSMTATMSSASLVGLADFEFVPLEEVDAESAELYAGADAERDATRLAVLGADEAAAVAARATVGGRDVTLLFEAMRYDDAWWIDTLGGRFAVLVDVPYQNAGVIRDDAESVPDASDGSDVPDSSGASDEVDR